MTDPERDALITEIHGHVLEMRAKMDAGREVCDTKHSVVNGRLDGLHKKIVGNGQPGIEQKLGTLTERFDRFEAKALAIVGLAVFLGQIFAPKLLRAMGMN